MDVTTAAVASTAMRATLGAIETARDRLRAAARVDWVSDQADVFRSDVWEAIRATYRLESAVREAGALAAPLASAGVGG